MYDVSVSRRFVELRCLGLVRGHSLCPALLPSFLTVSASPPAVSSQHSRSSCSSAQNAAGAPLPLQGKARALLGPPKLHALTPRPPRPHILLLPVPITRPLLERHTASSLLLLEPARHARSVVRASELSFPLHGVFFPVTRVAHPFTSSGLFSNVTFSMTPSLDALSPNCLNPFSSLRSFLEHLPPFKDLFLLFFCLPH